MQFENRMMRCAFDAATRSDDPKTKVGCVLVSRFKDKGEIVGVGTNVFPPGMARKVDVDDKLDKNKYIVHAEISAILNFTGRFVNTLECYVTHAPCSNCAKTLKAFGVRTVYYAQVHKNSDLEACEHLGLETFHLRQCKQELPELVKLADLQMRFDIDNP